MLRAPKLKLVTATLDVRELESQEPVGCYLCPDMVDLDGLPTAVAVVGRAGQKTITPICNSCMYNKLPREFCEFYNGMLRFELAIEERDLFKLWMKERKLRGKGQHPRATEIKAALEPFPELEEHQYDYSITCDYFVEAS